ncbi:MAG: transcriptional repressor [Clostridia bacterium]|nr:transcriptional repressor [Clostridia bacterium]
MATLKYSRQRESIKDFLMTRTDHPTADVVYHQLRKIYPNISLGTVYRNLSLLADIGEIQKIYTGDGVDHFDGQVVPHYHVVCTKCHRVMDLDMDYMTEVEEKASHHFNGKITSHITNFYGVCNDCLDTPDVAH